MTFNLARNLSAPARHYANVRPLEIHPAADGSGPRPVVADLGAVARRCREAPELAAWLLERLGEACAGDPVEALRGRIDREVERRGLAGCAVVSRAEDGSAEEGPELLTDLALALVLLSKASDVVWVARKTPMLDLETLGRRLVSRDPRFARGGDR
ncbi:MAG: hypothetical protein IT376_08325 [Polyangiaceae bacterium]|nr:hypothetical protein [Polyangiaceae bacterium]